jgi:hypothetical protein
MRVSPRTFNIALVVLNFSIAVGLTQAAETDPRQVAKATDLHVTRELNGQGTQLPIIATSASGRLYIVWCFKAIEKPAVGPIPFLPDECTFPTHHPEFATVPGISIFDGKTWAEPQRLAKGVRECEAVAAWCVGEDLHLLVTATFKNDVGYHLRYDASKQQWKRLHTLPVSPSNATRFVAQGESVYLASMRDGVKFWRYDGKTWSNPIPLESKDRDRPAIAVGDDHIAHLAWHSVDGGDAVGYATIKPDGTLTQYKTTLPIHGDDFDVAIGADGKFNIAYSADVPATDHRHDAVFVRSWAGDKWSEPALVGQDTGMMGGGIRLVSANKHLLLSWQHRAHYTVGRMNISGPIRSYSVFDGSRWTQPNPACTIPAGGASVFAVPGGFASAHFSALFPDMSGKIHMAWEDEGACYHAVIADLGAGGGTQTHTR